VGLKTPAVSWPQSWRGQYWTYKRLDQSRGRLTEEDVVSVYLAIPGGTEAICQAAGVRRRSARRLDRILTMLRRKDLARFDRSAQRWTWTTALPVIDRRGLEQPRPLLRT